MLSEDDVDWTVRAESGTDAERRDRVFVAEPVVASMLAFADACDAAQGTIDPRRWSLGLGAAGRTARVISVVGALVAGCADDDPFDDSGGGTTSSSTSTGDAPTEPGGSDTTAQTSSTGATDGGASTSTQSGGETGTVDGTCCEPTDEPECPESLRCCNDGMWRCFGALDVPCIGGTVCAADSGEECVWEEGGCEAIETCCQLQGGGAPTCCFGGPGPRPELVCTFYCFGM
jgi:hypothetical protein